MSLKNTLLALVMLFSFGPRSALAQPGPAEEPTGEAAADGEAGAAAGDATEEPVEPAEEREEAVSPLIAEVPVDLPPADLGPAPTTGADVEPDDGGLVPEGEEERMALHPVGAAGIVFRPGKGLQLSTDDDMFQLQLRLRGQLLYEVAIVDGEDAEQQITLRRVRLTFAGHLFGEDNRYKLELAISPRDMGIRDNIGATPHHTPILDLYFEFTHLRDLSLRVGQYKVPFSRERLISSGNLQMVDRSLVNSRFNLDRDVGVHLFSKDVFGLGMLRYSVGVTVGRGRDAVGDGDFRMAYSARIELLPMGMFDDHSEADFDRSTDPHLSLGVGGAVIDNARFNRGITGNIPADEGTTDTLHFTADAAFMVAGLSALTELHLRRGERNPGGAVDEMGVPIPTEAPSEGLGWLLQAGYLLPRIPFEIAARYAMVRRIGDETESILDDENELGVGLNYYFAQHPFKIQLDYRRLWGDDIGDGDHEIRLQLQASL